jgi:hypothetical protein
MSLNRKAGIGLVAVFLMAVATALLVQAAGTQAAGSEFTETMSLDAASLRVNNLIGEIQVVPATGSSFEIEIRVQGKDANRDRIKIETKRGRDAEISVKFPLEESTKYVYPKLGHGSRSSFMANHNKSGEHDGWWRAIVGALHITKIEVSGDGKGLEIWADVTVKVPKGGSLEVDHGTGRMEAADVEGDLSLDNASGNITGSNIRGSFVADTGSGNVSATRVTGRFSADTGSGNVTAESIEGEVSADTGSGNVSITKAWGEKVLADTGSGNVTVTDARCKIFSADTGSGNIDARDIAADEANLDTGSGGVRLALTRMGAGPFVIDTGSGGIELTIPADGSARVHAETGSGAIHVDFENENVHKVAHDELDFTIGDGKASVKLDAGSGSIHVSG